MDIVKIVNRPNGTTGQKVASVSIPATIAREIPEGATHMSVERFDGGILYRPMEPPRKES
jgi:hypothetical protein